MWFFGHFFVVLLFGAGGASVRLLGVFGGEDVGVRRVFEGSGGVWIAGWYGGNVNVVLTGLWGEAVSRAWGRVRYDLVYWFG